MNTAATLQDLRIADAMMATREDAKTREVMVPPLAISITCMRKTLHTPAIVHQTAQMTQAARHVAILPFGAVALMSIMESAAVEITTTQVV